MNKEKSYGLQSEVERLDAEDSERFAALCQESSQPVILSGGALAWPALEKWTPDYFRRRFASQRVRPSLQLPAYGAPYFSTEKHHRREMYLSEFIDILESGDACYVDQTDVHSFSGLEEDYCYQQFISPGVNFTSLWIGSKTRSGLHYDNMDNLFVQVYGEKKAILLAPQEARNLYPFGDCISKSRVDPERPDLMHYPRFAKAKTLTARLQPGDILFFPRGWWHHFSSTGPSISLSCWYGAPLTIAEQARGVNLAGRHLWFRILRDFLWHGVLGRAYNQRLFSTPPTGKLLYDLLFAPKRLTKTE
ncbi:cupin-like domain-containing protein [Hahella sp. KA22]|uniref:cupin-like domain-containing protein n=1 Tax=Hahella sp. KA22 TaxID=1628392 RepID=UPI0013E34863|nr:cupin-like domain-containing protein [Hahella sp. KA22]